MKRLRALSTKGLAILIGLPTRALSGGCGAPKPKVICTMKTPETGQKIEMFKEIWHKVPADYDEKRHIEQWKPESDSMIQ